MVIYESLEDLDPTFLMSGMICLAVYAAFSLIIMGSFRFWYLVHGYQYLPLEPAPPLDVRTWLLGKWGEKDGEDFLICERPQCQGTLRCSNIGIRKWWSGGLFDGEWVYLRSQDYNEGWVFFGLNCNQRIDVLFTLGVGLHSLTLCNMGISVAWVLYYY